MVQQLLPVLISNPFDKEFCNVLDLIVIEKEFHVYQRFFDTDVIQQLGTFIQETNGSYNVKGKSQCATKVRTKSDME